MTNYLATNGYSIPLYSYINCDSAGMFGTVPTKG
jgi:hypothetical protein